MKKTLFLAVPLLVLFSCQEGLEQDLVENGNGAAPASSGTVYHAVTESGSTTETRIYADENMKVLWNADDRISIFEQSTYNYQYKFTGDNGDTAGDFEKVTPEGYHTGSKVEYVYAAYPYSTTNKLSNSGVLSMILPATQSYKANSFGIGSNTMVAVSDGTFLAFKNVCGYLSISLYGDGVKVSKVSLQGKNGEQIAGKASIEMSLGGLPTATMDASATGTITIECNPAIEIGSSSSAPTTFWFAIPPVTFSGGITMTIEDDKGGVFSKSTSKEITINRNKVDRMAALPVVPEYASVKFADDKFEEYCVANFDTDNNGEITSDEASVVKSIDVCTNNITSLGGVEAFTNLESLKCTGSGVATRSSSDYNGQLTSLDVSALTQLKELDCRDNQLETLDVSNNPELETLICTENPMSEIKLAVGQVIPDLECPEETEIVYEWGEGIGPDKFPDEVFRDYVFNEFDTDGDGYLSDDELEAVTSIFVYTDNIESLQGIEYMTKLNSLRCFGEYGGKLNNLDVSKNTALTNLTCYSNQLTSLDVSNNTELNYLSCHNNQLTSLDVSNNTALNYLACNNNQLTSLDVSNNTALNYLACSGNQLASLDVSNNTALTYLWCYGNQLTSLDVSKNTALTYLYCDGNQLTSLDVSNNTALNFLYCRNNQLTSLDVSKNTALIHMVCEDNQLTSLDVSNNTALTYLICDGNQLTSLDVSNNTALTDLLCDNSTMEYLYLAVGQEISYLRKNDNTVILEIVPVEDPVFMQYLLDQFDSNSDGKLSGTEVEEIRSIAVCTDDIESLQGIEYMTNLDYLNCSGNNGGKLKNLDVSKNTALANLGCYHNQLTSLDVSKNTALFQLSCQDNQLTSLDVSNNTALMSLYCDFNQLTSLDLSNNTALKYLNCTHNQLTSLDVSSNTALARLDCRSNQLTSLDVSNNTALNNLTCYFNQLTSLDVSNNTALTYLQCSYNQLTSLDVSNNTALMSLFCDSNQLTILDVSKNTALTYLTFFKNQLTSLDVSNNTALTTLGCGYNQLTSLDVSENTALTWLDCRYNQLTSLDVSNNTELTELYCFYNQLTSLDVSKNTALTRLDCYSNQLTSLDVSENTALKSLNCSPMSTLATLYIYQGQEIPNVTSDRNEDFIPATTQIVVKP